MKIAVLAAVTIIGIATPLSPGWTKPHGRARLVHQAPNADLSPASLQTAREPAFRTVQPTDDGQGVLAPNGYRGSGSATGGPAGGIDDGGP